MKNKMKSLLRILLAVLLVSGSFTFGMFAVAADATEIISGDVDDNGEVDTRDLLRLRQYLANYNYDTGEAAFEIGLGSDMNGDGKITSLDIVCLRDYLVNKDFSEDTDSDSSAATETETVTETVTETETETTEVEIEIETESEVPKDYPECQHDIGVLDAVEPTCTKAGLTAGEGCVICGMITVSQEEIPALGHNIVTSSYNAEDKNYDQSCSRCKETVKCPVNYVVDPVLMQKYFADAKNVNFSSPEVYVENGISFARYTKIESGAAFFYPYVKNNTTLVTGEYLVIKYRITNDVTSLTTWSLYAGTETMKALDENDLVVNNTPFYDDGKWHVAMIKLDNTNGKHRFVPDENGDYYANYVRLGYISNEIGSTFDIQYVGFADDLEHIINLTEGENFGNDVFCTHYNIISYSDKSFHSIACVLCGEVKESAHSITEGVKYSDIDRCYLGICSVCDGIASAPFNLYRDPDDMLSCFNNSTYVKAHLVSVECLNATEDDIEFARFTPETPQDWMNMYLYVDESAEKVSGQYAVIKYRIPATSYSKSNIICYTGSVTSSTNKATVGASFMVSNVTANDEWIIAVYDMSLTPEFGANEDGTFSIKYLRLDMLVDSYIDIAFFGICDNLGAVISEVGDAICYHTYYNYDMDVQSHRKTECAICNEPVASSEAVEHTWGASVYDEKLGEYVRNCTECKKTVVIEANSALTVFFDPIQIKNSEHSGYSNPFTSSKLMSDDTEAVFLRFSGPGTGSSVSPFTTLIHNKVNVNTNTKAGQYLIIKYRYPESLNTKISIANLFVSSKTAPTAAESNKIVTNITADGNWHYIIIDAKNANTTEGFEGDVITMLRFDMFNGYTPTVSDYIDIAYVAISNDIDSLRNFDNEYDTYGLIGSSQLKNAMGDIAIEMVDEEHNGMPYVTITGKLGNFTVVNNKDSFFQGTGKYVAVLYRKDNSNPSLTAARLYLSTAKTYDDYLFAPYISDNKWHLALFDMSEYAAYTDGMAKTIRFDWFDFNTITCSIDIAYVKFFDSKEDVQNFYGEYVKKYLDSNNCDHYSYTWGYGQDGDPMTDTLKEFGRCEYCGAQMEVSRPIDFDIQANRVTDSLGSYPSDNDAIIGNLENKTFVFNASECCDVYPTVGITVSSGDDISVAGILTMERAVESVWFKVTDNGGATISTWKECRYSLTDSVVSNGLVATKFAAYSNLDGISGSNLTIVFAVVLKGVPTEISDRYLPIMRIENVSAGADVVKKSSFTADADLGILMNDIFDGNRVVNETVMFIDYGEARTLLYDIERIISVKSFDGSVTYLEGIDYALVDGKIQILEGSSIPCITSAVYYGSSEYKLLTLYNGAPTFTYEVEGKNMTKWQVNIEYQHSDSWNGYVQSEQSDFFTDFIEKLMNGEDVTIFYYGDSITVGASSTFYNNYDPYQYGYSYLLTHALADAFDYTVKYVDTEELMLGVIKPPPANDYIGGTRGTITYINTAIGGFTSENGLSNFQAHVADYIKCYGCDLFICGFGMNDKSVEASVTSSNVKKIVDGVITLAPDSAVMLVASMFFNNVEVNAETYNTNIKNQDVALKTLAENYRSAGVECGVASVGLVSESVLERKEFRDYTGNNINHPNDFFCRVYAQTVFKALIGYENLAD